MTTLNNTSLSGKEHPGPQVLCVPTELLHKIFTYLKPTEAANFRLLHKRIASIGIEYIVPEIFLALSEDSFNKLEAIAQHPEIRKHVSSMVFDATYLEDLSRELWEGYGVSLYIQDQEDEVQAMRTASGPEREARQAALVIWNSLPCQRYTKDQLDRAFAEYQRYRQEQSQLLRANAYLHRITQALANLPSLKNIVLDTHDECRTEFGLSTRKLVAVFGSGLCTLKANRRYDYPVGQSEVHAILNSVHRAGLRLESFTCSLLSWWYFSDNPAGYASYIQSLFHLKSLDLVISTMDDMDGFNQCLCTGRVLRFLTATPYLERLKLGSFTKLHLTKVLPNLRHFVGSFRWTLLVQVTIEDVQTSENVFKGFLERHSSTLRSVVLGSLSLLDGEWMSIFRMMRSVLRLDEMVFNGVLRDGNGFFSFAAEGIAVEDSFKRNVHDYFVGGTKDPQSIEAYFNGWRNGAY